MQTATLKQVQKILSYLKGVPSRDVQKAIESGEIPRLFKSGSLDQFKEDIEAELIGAIWKLIAQFTRLEGVYLTFCHHESDDGRGGHEVRCWLGQHGAAIDGHVSDLHCPGQILFEARVADSLDTARSCWPKWLQALGSMQWIDGPHYVKLLPVADTNPHGRVTMWETKAKTRSLLGI